MILVPHSGAFGFPLSSLGDLGGTFWRLSVPKWGLLAQWEARNKAKPWQKEGMPTPSHYYGTPWVLLGDSGTIVDRLLAIFTPCLR